MIFNINSTRGHTGSLLVDIKTQLVLLDLVAGEWGRYSKSIGAVEIGNRVFVARE